MYISTQLSGKRRNDLENPDVELLWVEVHIPQLCQTMRRRPLLVGCCYQPPNSPVVFYKNLAEVMDCLKKK